MSVFTCSQSTILSVAHITVNDTQTHKKPVHLPYNTRQKDFVFKQIYKSACAFVTAFSIPDFNAHITCVTEISLSRLYSTIVISVLITTYGVSYTKPL